MTWDPYGMPNAPRDMLDMHERPDHRLPAQKAPASLRAVLAVLAAMALLALLFAGAANAQQTMTEQQQQTEQQQAQQEPSQTGTAPAEQEAAAVPLEGQIVEQPEGTFAASELIGSYVFSAAGEDMGRISDLLVSEDNRIVGVIIGIGGFLGIGEKPIAVELDRLKRTATQEGGERLELNFTREQLEQAPQFVSLAEQMRRQEAERARQQQEQQQQQDLLQQ